jgi:hypothetical protein
MVVDPYSYFWPAESQPPKVGRPYRDRRKQRRRRSGK